MPTVLLSLRVLAFCSVIWCFTAASQENYVKLDLKAEYNIKAASTGPSDPLANIDGSGRAYPVEWLPTGDTFSFSGVEFSLPPFHDSQAFDTVNASLQVIPVPNGNYQSFHSLLTWSSYTGSGAKAANISFNFEDGSSEISGLIIGSWWSRNPYDGPIRTPYHYANASLDANMTISHNVTEIQYASTRVTNDKKLVSITLPAAKQNIRIFSISLLPTSPLLSSSSSLSTLKQLRVQNVRSTTKWVDLTAQGSPAERIQLVEVTISNAAALAAGFTSWITSPLFVHLSSGSIRTIVPGTFMRLRSNDQIIVTVGIVNQQNVEIGSDASVQVVLTDSRSKPVRFLNEHARWDISAGILAWQPNDKSMGTHETPNWFDDAKFGIFVHYGLYSVPAWAPPGVYAEWYNWYLHNPANASSPIWSHHLETYGANFTYEDFFANWTAKSWNPDDWTDLFADSGAKYFVLVTKHHDGVVMFDTKSTDRNSVKLGPKRNFLKELFASAKSRHPELHRGTYFSLPEWFNPAYEIHGKPSFPGGLALNAFTGECCDPYTGYKPVKNFLEDVQKPQMEALFYEYDTDILWCDVGYDSVFPQIGADWFNYAASQGRQVVMNNRCGANQSDFVTPEYATFSSPLSQKWESSAGMDPHSYGYNSATPLDKYENASSIVQELVDIVSKGGNLLLDIGPKEDGTIISQMTQPLLEVGEWLKKSGEAIYGTRPWWFQAQDNNLRFTTTGKAFYIIALARPTGVLRVAAPVPIVPEDQVTLLGGTGNLLQWSEDSGTLVIEVGDAEMDLISLPIFAFRISYGA